MSIPTWNEQMVWNVEEAAVAFQANVQEERRKTKNIFAA
jgi:hypothetical protein